MSLFNTTTTSTSVTSPISFIPVPSSSSAVSPSLQVTPPTITPPPTTSPPTIPPTINPARARDITWPESVALVTMMKTEGKNWGKLLQQLHGQHLFTHMGEKDKDKLRIHYNHLKGKKSQVWKEYETPKFVAPKNASQEEIQRQFNLHALKHNTIRTEREMLRGYIKLIEDREVLIQSDTQKTEAEITKEMREKGEERRQVRDERLEKAEKLAEEEQSYRKALTESIKEMQMGIKRAQENEEKLFTLLADYVAVKKQKLSQ